MLIFGRWFALALLNMIFIHKMQAIRWLGIRTSSEQEWNITHCRFLSRRKIFLGEQTRTCKRHLPIMKYVSEAVEYTKEECQNQMRTRRWNCSSILRAPRYLKDIARSTKESAYVYALASAALTYTVTHACSIGRLKTCGCGKRPKQKLEKKNGKWGGCNDNIAYGYRFSKRFTDHKDMSLFRTTVGGALMIMHNNEVGRKAVRDTMEIICRCHGVSGSCQIETCFRRLSDFKVVAGFLKKKYDRVVRVRPKTKNERTTLVTKKSKFKKKLTTRHLIALESSPNFCVRNPRSGSLGTEGRQCSRKGRGHGSCRHLCCARGHRRFNEIKVENCNCRMASCCRVKCDKCKKVVGVYRCR